MAGLSGGIHLSQQETISSPPRLHLRCLGVHGVDAGMGTSKGTNAIAETDLNRGYLSIEKWKNAWETELRSGWARVSSPPTMNLKEIMGRE
jgi:hypothetical protein